MSEPQPPAFQFYASDYLSSSKVQQMPLEAQGAYMRLLCYNWQDGTIPADIESLAKLCGVTRNRMKKLWIFLRDSFSVAENFPDKLVNERLESVRRDQANYRKRQQEAGKLGNDKRWGRDRTATDSRSPEHRSSSPSPSPSSSPSSTEEGKGKKQGDSPPAEKRGGRPDPAADAFADSYLIRIGNPYGWMAGDFPQLAKLRKRLKIE